MTMVVKISCNGQQCNQKFEIEDNNYDSENIGEYDWSWDCINDFHYCTKCTKKMIESGELEANDI